MEKSEKQLEYVSETQLRYSFPCGRILKSEGVLPEEDYDLLVESVNGKAKFPADKFRKYFIVVMDFVDITASKDEVRKYFWFSHNSEIRPAHCLTVPGTVKEVSGKVTVRNLFTGKDTETTPVVKVKEGDYVVIHLNHLVDKISKGDANKMLEHLKKIRFTDTSKRISDVLPAKVVSISEPENRAVVDDGTEKRSINIKLIAGKVKVGDHVLVHYTHAFKVINEEESRMLGWNR
jgi:hydrogenase assembly chaperone HypC/HupF